LNAGSDKLFCPFKSMSGRSFIHRLRIASGTPLTTYLRTRKRTLPGTCSKNWPIITQYRSIHQYNYLPITPVSTSPCVPQGLGPYLCITVYPRFCILPIKALSPLFVCFGCPSAPSDKGRYASTLTYASHHFHSECLPIFCQHIPHPSS
jgi:hypothetical protein